MVLSLHNNTDFRQDKILIWGLGLSGMSALQLALKHYQRENIFVFDSRGHILAQAQSYLPAEQLLSAAQFPLSFSIDLVVLSPGIDVTSSFHKSLISPFLKQNKVISEIEFAYLFHSHIPVIAVTGSNGKSTVVSMFKFALEMIGKTVFLGGNWGVPYSSLYIEDENNYDYALIEVSSFQLERVQSFRPRLAIITNIYHHHQERYQGWRDYAAAKLNLLSNLSSSDSFITNRKTWDKIQQNFSNLSFPQPIFYDEKEQQAYIDDRLWQQSLIPGMHNRDNFVIVATGLQQLGLSHEQVYDVMSQLVPVFSGVEHRIERFLLPCKNNLIIYNDSKSTNWIAASAALAAMDKNVTLALIFGGKLSAQYDYIDEMIKILREFHEVSVYCYGESAKVVDQLLTNYNVKSLRFSDLDTLITCLAKDVEQKKCQILFSPGHSSYDLYENFEQRGQHFKVLIANHLGR